MFTGFGSILFEGMFFLAFFLFFGIFIVNLIRNIGRWNKNNHSPKLIVEAEVVDKRDEVYRRHNANTHHTHISTTYYATFQFETGDRLELELRGHEYGMLVVGDKGKLTFQGTRFLGFERT